jgi:glycosyltransferase involved in cell wall biosynthesis
MKKVCVITCYAQPDYVRARTIRAALGLLPDVEVIVVKNTHRGLLRYPEVLWKVFVTRITRRPDIYLQTFRAYESFPFIRLLTIGKKFVFDEFVNPIEQVAYEHHRIKPGGFVATVARLGYKVWLSTVSLIITDTPSHAAFSAQLMKIPLEKYVPLIVSTDEETFDKAIYKKPKPDEFRVFFYGLYMLPLHGLDVMLDAMKLLTSENITLHIIGGKAQTAEKVHAVQHENVKVTYEQYVPYEDLVGYIHDADVVLGGPFGNTVQSQFVIGGKVLQFLRSGKPTIIGINQESKVFTDKKDSLLIPQGDPQALADVLLWAKEHPQELKKVGEAGRELYEAKLSNKILADQLRSLLARKELS